MKDESICIFNTKKHFAKFLGFKVQDSEKNFLNPDPGFKIQDSEKHF